MTLCPHDNYRKIDNIREPKYSTDQILISVGRVDKNTRHYLIKFTKCAQYPDWFYMDYDTIHKSKRQPNGRGEVYAVNMSQRQEFIPNIRRKYGKINLPNLQTSQR